VREELCGYLIRRERLRRDWSQEGLCRGICAASYLSKIEQGKTRPSEEIVKALFARLGQPWYGAAELGDAPALLESAYDVLLSGDTAGFRETQANIETLAEKLRSSPFAMDAELLLALMKQEEQPLDAALEPYLDARQLALQRLLQGREQEAIRLCPEAFFYYWAGAAAYERGGSYAAAMSDLQRGCDLAARDGRPHLMLLCRMLMGNCYANLLETDGMEREYTAARRLATALGRGDDVRAMDYNSASTRLETGDYHSAYAYFSALETPSLMDLHKLAVCCEKLDQREAALAALDRADAMESEWPETQDAREMCALVRFRLEHPDYLRRSEYGSALLAVFRRCREKLPVGYAGFHLPWVLEWYTATRRYREACELLREFPLKTKYI
jgi:transcriptional regulator with XRE-family HTH domain